MNGHLKAGGLIVAATHVPLGVKADKNLHLEGGGQA
jgi:ABC-type transport system involved in cytochrome c biogenesis ATPase subunit